MKKSKLVIFIIALCLIACTLGALAACKAYYPPSGAQFTSTAKSSFSRTFTQIEENETNFKNRWRDGMVSGNGKQGVIVAGSPY